MQHTNTTDDAQTTDENGEALRFEEVDVIEASVRNNTVTLIRTGRAVTAADLLEAESLKFDADTEAGQLLAVGLDIRVDGRSEPHGRPFSFVNGRDSPSREVGIPKADFESAFGLSVDDVRDEPLRLRVFANAEQRALLFERADTTTVDADRVEALR